MTPIASWLLIISIGLAIKMFTDALYIDSLKKEAEKNKPPF